jgi:hypothetical protein
LSENVKTKTTAWDGEMGGDREMANRGSGAMGK